MPDRDSTAVLYAQLARLGKAVASPSRVELLDLLCQGERSVEALARATSMSVTNTSQHLQTLKAARLVDTRREGARIFYRLADDEVCRFLASLRGLARARLAEVEQVVRDTLERPDRLEPVSRAGLLERMRDGDVVVLDVRPTEEYTAGHIPGAISIPLAELEQHLDSLPRGSEIVAYCRGPLCVLAPRAIDLLHTRGFRARRLVEGLPEWRLAGLPVEIGAEPARP